MSVYTENGYKDRRDYLENLEQEFDCPLETVLTLASILGKSEDFDGLICALEDYENGIM